MHKLLADFLSEPTNALFPFTADFVEQPSHLMGALEFRGETKVRSLWIGQSGNGKVTIAFPDGTLVNGNFKRFQMESGVIEFPTGVVIEGKFAKIDHCAIGLMQTGKVYLSDGKYLEIDCSGLMLMNGRLMDSSDQELICFNGCPLVEFEDCDAKSRLTFDTHTFTVEKYDKTSEQKLLHKTVYSYFGPYYSPVTPFDTEQVNCTALNDMPTSIEPRLPTLANEDGCRIDQSCSPTNNLCLSIDGVEGVITLNVNDTKKPLYGYGFFANGSISIGIQVILLPNHKYFISQNKLYTTNEFKKLLMSIEEGNRKEVNDDFINIPDQLNSPLSIAPTSDTFEFNSGALQLLAETLLKYHSLRQTFCQEKERSSHQLQRLGSINQTILQENEYLVSKVIEGSKNLAELHNELIRYSTILQHKIQQISNLTSDLSIEKDYTKRLEKINHELKKVYNQKEKEFRTLLKEIQQSPTDACHELRTVKYHNVVLIQENSILVDLKAGMDSTIRDLESKYTLLQSEFQKIEQENQLLASEVQALSTEKKELLQNFDQLSNLSGNFKIKLNQLELLSNEKDLNIESQRKKIVQFALQLEELQASKKRNVILEFRGQMVNDSKQGPWYVRTQEYEYEGELKDDKFCGKGKLVFISNQKKLDGIFDENGHFSGTKIRVGETDYQGSIVNNQMHGKGALIFVNNFIVEGVFNNDEFDSSQSYQITNLGDGTEETAYVHPKRAKCLMTLDNVCYEVDFEKGQLKPSQ